MGALKGKTTIERLLDLNYLILILNCTWCAFPHICKRIEANAHRPASMSNFAELILRLDVICLWRRMQTQLLLLVEIQHSFCLRNRGKLVEASSRAVRLRPASLRKLGGWFNSREPFRLRKERQLL